MDNEKIQALWETMYDAAEERGRDLPTSTDKDAFAALCDLVPEDASKRIKRATERRANLEFITDEIGSILDPLFR